jgi:uncharacterized protein
MPNRVVHFEIHASDIERAKAFYGVVFGWEFPLWIGEPPYWGVMTAPQGSTEPGINGGLLQRSCEDPAENDAIFGYVCTVQVDDYDATHEKILAAGGAVALPKMAIAGMAWQGYFKDTEGNIFGVHQTDSNAR